MPRLSKIGAAALAAFGWTGGASVSASYLVVAGGGGGGDSGDLGGGGGAGGYLTGTSSLNPTLSYVVTVGAGGAPDVNGGNSVFNLITSIGGGKGGTNAGTLPSASGGSGGGGGATNGTGSAGTAGQGNAGGNGDSVNGGGGGGASQAGNTGGQGYGGNGTASSISGSSVTYAGGGGGSAFLNANGYPGGTGGGGSGGGTSVAPTPGTSNTGGGGGGVRSGAGMSGGSGIVIISYAGAQQFGGGVVTSVGGNTIHTFTTSGTLSPITSLSASYLVVAGGGSGGYDTAGNAGGGGAGGLLTGTGLTLDANSIYTVTVGAGGTAPTAANSVGNDGSNSAFGLVATTAVGGGGGGTYSNFNGRSGGSGGGGGQTSGAGGAGTSGQGNAGGTNSSIAGSGGGGAGAVGVSSSTALGGNGGAGSASSISGTSTNYAGGGGGSNHGSAGSQGGLGGTGGGGNGHYGATAGQAGTANTGGGGGGGGETRAAGNGGSGVVIISYAGSTQQMSGGTVTIVGGNVIHTFTSSGYLTPIVLLNRSLRFRSSANAYLGRTPATAGNRQTWTWSGWVKRGTLGAQQYLFQSVIDNSGVDTNKLSFFYNSDNTLNVFSQITVFRKTNAVFRDPAAWYHIVLVADTNNATANNRFRLYINNVEQTYSTINNPSSGLNTAVNAVTPHYIASEEGTATYFDGYMTEVNFIDGQALTPSSFGSFNAYGSWSPVRYGGSYGTNGFYLPFTNNASTTTLGYDFSPQGNNWTTNNISLTAGVTYDSMTDVPTLTSATAANYCTLNPVLPIPSGTISQGNLNYLRGSAANHGSVGATFAMPTTGKWYWEVTACASANNEDIGVANILNNPQLPAAGAELGGGSRGDYAYRSDGNKYNNGNQGAYGATYANGDVIGVAWNSDSGTLTFYKNGTSQGTAFSSITQVDGKFVAASSNAESSNGDSYNFGQRPFAYTPPSGFVALNTYNL
jgi:hypothetical protein